VGHGARSAIQLLAAGLALAGPAGARAGVTGNVEVQAESTQTLSRPYGGSTQTTAMTLLTESLSLHYAGLPFGPAVAVVSAGGAFTNVNAWYGNGLSASGQVLSFDAAVGFLPRRAVPLRLYAGGTVVGGTTGPLASHGAGPSLLYGGTLSLEPGKVAPGVRVDLSEARGSRPGQPDLSDVQRRLLASAWQAWGGQRLQLAVRLEDDHRERAGDVTTRGATLDWSGARHQTSAWATEVRRTLPVLGGITSDRQVAAQSEQRWTPALSTQVAGRLSEASGGGATGRLGDARAGFAWRAIEGTNQLTFSAGGNGGTTRTRSAQGDSDGNSWGASARAAYGRLLGWWSAGLAAGAATNTCDCAPGNRGTANLLDATLTLALSPAARGSAQADWTVVRASAPLARGGDRTESHARAYGWLTLSEISTVNASLGWDDGQREVLDIVSGQGATLRERALSGSLGATSRWGAFTPLAEVRHARNTVLTDGSPFVAGRPTLVRSITSGLVGLTWNPRHDLGLMGQLRGSFAEVSGAEDLTTLAANLSATWRVGRLFLGAHYQGVRSRQGGTPATFQQSIRAVLSRPFEL
jgi:hypothetical protein